MLRATLSLDGLKKGIIYCSYPAVVAWSVECLLHKKCHVLAVDRISLEAKCSCVDSENKKGGFYAEWACGCIDSLSKKEGSMQNGLQKACVMQLCFIHSFREIEERLYEHCLLAK